MRPVVIDFETFFGDDFTLSKMSTEAYIRDPRFEAHGGAIKWSPDERAIWYDKRELPLILKEEDWSDVFLICHHTHFDGLILSHHYGVVPAMYGCTLSMARLLLGNHLSVSLDNVRKHFDMPLKKTPYNLFRGKRWHELTPPVREEIADGACDEVESIWHLFANHLAPQFPAEEYDVVDSTIRMFTQPVLTADVQVLKKVWEEEAVRKQTLLQRLGVTEAQLQSSNTFANLLRERGVEPGLKNSPSRTAVDGQPGQVYAFAKTDPFMEDLLGDEDDEVRALAEARLGVKSTLLQTRAETIGFMAQRGFVCIYLHYAGAHTSRWSGGDKTNFQNWTNGSSINTALIAPDGFLIAEPDASQIECRLLNFVAGQHNKVEEFRSGADPYVSVASEFYGFEVNKKDHPDERQLGKIVELQAGYGSGGDKIRQTVRIKSGGKLLLTAEEGVKARDAYRDTHPRVVAYWREAEMALKRMLHWLSYDWGPMRVECNAENGTRRIILPNGISLIFDTLEWYVDGETDEEYFRLKTRRGWAKMYGAKLVENVIQALARVVVSQAMTRLKHRGYRSICTKHDSLWLLIPKDGRLDEHKAVILEEMRRTPTWLPGIPLDAEFKHIGERYG